MFSDYEGIILAINNRKTFEKSPNIQKLNEVLLNNSLVKEEIKKELRRYFERN